MTTSYDIQPVRAWLRGVRIELQVYNIIGDVPLDGGRSPWAEAPPGSLYTKTNDPPQLWQKKSDLIWQRFVDNWDLESQALDDHVDVLAPAPVDGMRLAWEDDVQQWIPKRSESALGIVQLPYKFSKDLDCTPKDGDLQFNNVTPALVTEVCISDEDSAGIDVSLYLENIYAGSWLNIHDKDNADDYMLFDVLGDPVVDGNVYTVPVELYEESGAWIDNRENVSLFIRYTGSSAALLSRLDTLEGLVAQLI